MEEQTYNTIDGTVSSIIFRNDENGYTVLRLKAGEGEITVVGCIPEVAPGEGLTLSGRWMRHASYGEQFKAEVMERRLPAGERAIFEYLSSGVVTGIGMATARKLVAEFGEDTLNVLEEEPDKLTRIRGITPKRAREMSDAFRARMGMRRLLEFLGEHGLPVPLGMPLYRRYGNLALEMLKGNPYLLVDPEFGVDFALADQLAADLGIEAEDPKRIEAAVLFELTYNLNNGHTFLPRRKMVPATAALLAVEDTAVVEDGLDVLIDRGEVMEEPIAGEKACYLTELYTDECYVAFRMEEMSAAEYSPPEGLDRLIASIEREQGITYAPQQREAVALAAQRQVMLLTGGPGTGKTTSLRGVLALFEAMGLDTALAAPTGRAAKRLGDLCGTDASTIHRLLETTFDNHTGRLAFTHNEREPLKADAVIVDESSMVDISLMHALLASLRPECRLVLVGDPDQLPSVGPGCLLSDLLRSGVVPTVRLTEIFRQASESAIVMNAHGVNRGELPRLNNAARDFFFLRRLDGVSAVDTIVDLVVRRLPVNMGIPVAEIQVLSPTRKYATGTAALNRALQEAVNPPAEGKGERRFGELTFRTGDRVMQVKNNYDVLWRAPDGSEGGMGIWNGDIGQILAIDHRQDTVTVDFEGRQVEYTADMLGELELAYAVTVHKAQGSEYRAVILAALDGAPMLMTRGVLYTAITRAKELFIIVGDEQKIQQMVNNDRQQRRYSGLKVRLQQGRAGG